MLHFKSFGSIASVLIALSACVPAECFVPSPIPSCNIHTLRMNSGGDSIGSFGGDGMGGGMEEIEFTIYPDGRVTEVVRGVKGGNCQKLTESINKNLGKVVDSSPTEEMFEQELVVDQTLQQKIGGEGGVWDGSMGGSW
ncbi:hypothetical protein ACHAXS_006354 [Conticribra weissflogii]